MVQRHAEFLPEAGIFLLSADGDFFINHSDDPNIEDHGAYSVARKDIQVGEELTMDYRIVRVVAFPVPVDSATSDAYAIANEASAR